MNEHPTGGPATRTSLSSIDLGRLRERLHALQTGPAPARTATREGALPELLGGEERDGCLVIRRDYAATHHYGGVTLQGLWQRTGTTFATLGKDPALTDFDFRRTLFIDTETNGIAGGTGTYAFLIGVGYWNGERFTIEQFFMRHPAHEQALLAHFSPLLERYDSFVSFNGKSFDLSVLEARYILNRQARALKARPHLDLLHPARRLWSRRLRTCTLSHLEQRILGVVRTEQDVPGYLIPQIYNDFLRSGAATALQRVIYHNHHDVLALATLATHMARCLQAPERHVAPHGQDLFSLACLYEDGKHWTAAEQCYRDALRVPLPLSLRREVIQRLSMLLKRLGRWDEACALWQSQLGQGLLYPYVELAKFYEHRARDLEYAQQLVEQALSAVLPLDRASRLALHHRLGRLQRKQGNIPEPARAPSA